MSPRGVGRIQLKKCNVHLGDVNTETSEQLFSQNKRGATQWTKWVCQWIQTELDPVVVNLFRDWQP